MKKLYAVYEIQPSGALDYKELLFIKDFLFRQDAIKYCIGNATPNFKLTILETYE